MARLTSLVAAELSENHAVVEYRHGLQAAEAALPFAAIFGIVATLGILQRLMPR